MSELQKRIETNFKAQGLMQTLGATLEYVSEGEVHIAMPFSGAVSQQRGFVHAGAVTSIVDSACGYAALSKAEPGCDVVSAEFKINLMRPAIGKKFLAVGKVVNAGRTLTVCTGEVRAFDKSQTEYKVVAIMQATMVIVRP